MALATVVGVEKRENRMEDMVCVDGLGGRVGVWGGVYDESVCGGREGCVLRMLRVGLVITWIRVLGCI